MPDDLISWGRVWDELRWAPRNQAKEEKKEGVGGGTLTTLGKTDVQENKYNHSTLCGCAGNKVYIVTK